MEVRFLALALYEQSDELEGETNEMHGDEFWKEVCEVVLDPNIPFLRGTLKNFVAGLRLIENKLTVVASLNK